MISVKQLIYRTAGLAPVVLLLAAHVARAQYVDAPSEQDLIAILQDGAPAEKALACKQLAIHGTKQSVPELAKLLGDERLASWSRIALEAIPDPACDDALRSALESLEGQLLIGAINSIGVRRDEQAVEPLTRYLESDDAQVAASAAVALGHIGNADATAALRRTLAEGPSSIRAAVAEGCVLCAERSMNENHLEQAAAIYDEVRRGEVPSPWVVAATRGAILARKTNGVPLLLEQLGSDNQQLVYIGLTAARELQGENIAELLAQEIAQLNPDRASLLILAIAERGEPALPAAVLQAAREGDKQVRLAAIDAVGRVSDEASLSLLLESAADDDADVSQAAKQALVQRSGENVDQQIVARLGDAQGKSLAVLLEVVGQRRIEATEPLIKALENDDPTVRHAALEALGATIGPDQLGVLIEQLVNPRSAEDAAVAQRALLAASVRMPDRDACAAALAAAMEGAPLTTQEQLLEIIAAVGGAKSLETIAESVRENEALRDVGTRVLGEWMSLDAAPVLLDLAKSLPDNRYQVRALRGYIRLARQFAMSDDQRAEMCHKALAAATRPDEQRLVLAVLERYPSPQALRVAVEAAKTPALRDDARRTTRAIAEKLGRPVPE